MITVQNRFLWLVAIAAILCSCDRPREPDTQSQDAKPLILVTGATGRQGGAVARELLRRGFEVRGLTRNPESDRVQLRRELGIEMVKGDFDDPASLDRALDGAFGVFGVTNFWEHGYDREVRHGQNLIDAAIRSNTRHFVFSSVGSANQETGIPHFESKWEVEKYLQASGLAYTVVRPVSFMENWSLDDDEIVAGEILTAGTPDKPHQYISVRDIGHFVGEIFDSPAHWNRLSIDIAGDERSLIDLCSLLSQLTGREITFRRISWEEYEARFGEESTMMSKWFDQTGYSADITSLRLKHPHLMTLEEYFKDQLDRATSQ